MSSSSESTFRSSYRVTSGCDVVPSASRHTKVESWPRGPRVLRRRRRNYVLVIANLVMSLLFLGLSIASLCVNGQPVPSMTGNIIQQVSHVGPSIFPVVFTSLMSNAFESIGRLYSERSITLNELRFFLTTKSTSDAICALKDIRRMSPLIFTTLIIWALSPLGGQASLRILLTTNHTETTTGVARYPDTGPLRHHFLYSDMMEDYNVNRQSSLQSIMGAEVRAAITQPIDVLESPTDNWGNFKVPWIDTLENGQSSDWISTENIRGADSYTSLTGIPIHRLPVSGTKSLQVETSYLTLACSPLMTTESEYRIYGPYVQINCPECPLWNTTRPSDLCRTRPLHAWCERLAAFLGLHGPDQRVPVDANIITVSISPCNGGYCSQMSATKGFSTSCVVTEKHVELRVKCNKSCYAEAMRLSQDDKRPTNSTPFDYWAGFEFANSSLLGSHSNIGMVRYLIQSSNRSSFGLLDYGALSSRVTKNQFSLRLGAILNTYIQAYIGSNTIPHRSSTIGWSPEFVPSRGLRLLSQSSDLAQINDRPGEFFEYPGYLNFAAANVTITNSVEVYRTATIWAVVLLVCSLTLLGIGAMGILFDFRSIAPNRFDPVLGQTFDNTEFGLEGGTTLDVDDRMRLLGQLKVQVGDVRKGWDVGRIGFALEENVGPLQLGRLYE